MEAFNHFVFRAVNPHDLDTLYAFSLTAGLTNLPPDRTLLTQMISKAFPHAHDLFFFVMEDLRTHTVAGCCAIYADIGNEAPYYTFKVDHTALVLNAELKSVSEMGALYLSPEYRHHHLGSFLSRARFVFMASYPRYFHDIVIAEMRGRRDKKHQSPFWEDFSHHYIRQKSFVEADLEVARHHLAFIDQQMPHTPIPVHSLTKRARACIGLPDRTTRPAISMLMKEHFVLSKYVNVFDAGPLMIARTDEIQTMHQSEAKTFAGTQQAKDATLYFIAKISNDFRVVVSPLHLQGKLCYLPENVAQVLHVSINDSVLISPF